MRVVGVEEPEARDAVEGEMIEVGGRQELRVLPNMSNMGFRVRIWDLLYLCKGIIMMGEIDVR